jgi:RNA processing factor Prp31
MAASSQSQLENLVAQLVTLLDANLPDDVKSQVRELVERIRDLTGLRFPGLEKPNLIPPIGIW